MWSKGAKGQVADRLALAGQQTSEIGWSDDERRN